MFFEHRALLDAKSARRPYPGDDFVIPFGRAQRVRTGRQVTVVTWGAMVHRVQEAVASIEVDAEILDLRTLMPWDSEAVFESVARTGRCLVVHEDVLTAGFGAEVAAQVASEMYLLLKAPVDRLAVSDIPLPYNPGLLQAALPSSSLIANNLEELVEF